MKKISLLLVVFSLICTSCNIESVDYDGVSGDVSIVGEWKMVNYTYTGETTTSGQGQTLSTSFIGEAFDMNNTITFSQNPNTITSNGAFSIKLTSTTLGQTSTQNITGIPAINDGTWEQEGDELFTFSNGQEGVMKIEELTENRLVLTVNHEEDLSQSGFTIISTIDAEIMLVRVDSEVPSTNIEGNKLILNGEEFTIENVLTYFEGSGNPANFYYHDITFLSEGLQYSFSDEGPIVTGTGSILDFSLLSETKLIKDGEYRHDVGDPDTTPFNIDYPMAYINHTFNNSDIYEEQTGFIEAEFFDNATFNVERDGDIYTITGSGTFNGISFELQYIGEITVDPDSDI